MDLFEPIWKGLIIGILFTLTFGTVFFSIIQTSIKRGLIKALFIALGVVLSDAFFITAAVLGTVFIADEIKTHDIEIRLIGFSFLLILGIRSIVKKEIDHTNDEVPIAKKDILYIIKGIMLNSINPMILISWMGVTTYIETVHHFSLEKTVLFYLVVLATMFSTMLGISYFARKLKNVLSAENMNRLNVGSGIIFIIFAGIIIWPLLVSLMY